MTVQVFRDDVARAVYVIRGTVGTWPFNTLHAVLNVDSTISVINNSKEYPDQTPFFEIDSMLASEYVDETGTPFPGTPMDVTNALNTIFSAVFVPTDAIPPLITSNLALAVAPSEPINYFLEADRGVGYHWGAFPTGMGTAFTDIRNLIGAIALPGVYNVDMVAVNEYGTDEKVLVITVGSGYTNSHSIQFNNQDYMTATADTSNPLYRAGNGSGAADAWTISLWFRPGTSGNNNQTILQFGGDAPNEGIVHLSYDGSDQSLRLFYGQNSNNLELQTAAASVTVGIWSHVFITYDGGTTGTNPAEINDYYGRFSIAIDGVVVATTNSNSGNGFAGGMATDVFYIGRIYSGNHLRNNCLIDEPAIWASDQSANLATIYNGGVPLDLLFLASPPEHWWRMGDGDTFPTISDNGTVGGVDFTMVNMTAGDIVSIVP